MAREIFMYRLSHPPSSLWLPTPASLLLARQYGITPKAVRDIWTRRTWARATDRLELPDDPQDPGAAAEQTGGDEAREGEEELQQDNERMGGDA
eukprot:767515-Hanusia_phi.AAC.1